MGFFKQTIRWGVSLAVVAALAWTAGRFAQPSLYRDLRAEKERIERRQQQLQRIVERLTTERRVAEVDVLERRPDSARTEQTVLRFIEFDRHDRPLPERTFTIPGNVVFFDALVIKFTEEGITADDPLRGKSIALFRRIFGETQAPIEGRPIDTAGDVPNVYRIAPDPTDFELQLWEAFWSYATDPAKAEAAGVRVAQGEAVYAPLSPGEKWTLTLENDGGLNLVKQPPPAAPSDKPSEQVASGPDRKPDT